MANKIISIGNNTQQPISNEIFKDISMRGASQLRQVFIHNYTKTLQYDGNNNAQIAIDDNIVLDADIDIDRFSAEFDDSRSTSHVMVKSNKYTIDKLINVHAVFNSLHNIFHWIPGERILNPEFGSKLYMLLYNGITEFTSEQIIAEIQHCVSKWEPRVQIINVIDVSTTDDTENNTIQLDIIFSIPSLDNTQYKYSYVQNIKSE